jgi:RNA polymerase sigma factor (TIGR02999 family)
MAFGQDAGPPPRVNELLQRLRQGEQAALEELVPLLYRELHRIAHALMLRQRPGHTLQTTALVNEACIKLIEAAHLQVEDRAHFLALVARAMRQVLVDHARALGASKRGGAQRPVPWDARLELQTGDERGQLKVLELESALLLLASRKPELARIVEMHYFGGMTGEEMAVVLGRTAHAVRHDLRAARAWLRRELARES